MVWTGPKGQKFNVFDVQTKMFPLIHNSVRLIVDDLGSGALVTAPHGARRAENRAAIDLFNPRTNKWINVWNQVLSGTAVTFAGFTTEFPMQDVAGIRLRIDPVGDTTAWQFWEGVVFHFGTLSDGLLTLQSESAIIASAADTTFCQPFLSANMHDLQSRLYRIGFTESGNSNFPIV